MTNNNHKLDLINVYTRKMIGKILSIRSQDIERKRISDVNQRPYSDKILRKKKTGTHDKLDLFNIEVHTKYD